MEGGHNNSIRGDRALNSNDQDRLGFREVAKRIAISLVDRASEDGLVVGLEGTWGSGKSSLLFLIEDELGKVPDNLRPSVVNFRPWLIGNRDALITSLFGELSCQLDLVALEAGDATPVSITKAKEAGEALRGFVKGLSRAGAAIEFVGKVAGVGIIEMAGTGVRALGEATGEGSTSPQLSELKAKLVKSLRELGHRFIVTIDDVDRLEPAEVLEVLRLARSVVDLPNVIYLLCYDSEILAHSIEKAAGAKNGRSFLEKIVQLTVMVPKPEPLQLRQWFSDELHLIASTKNEDELSRLKAVIDYEGGRQLRTPRSVVRALDAIRFFWSPLREAGADLADLVWLQLIKDGNPALYRWVEDYCATAAVVSLGAARVEDAEKTQNLAELLTAVPRGHFDDPMYRHHFAEQLPDFEVDYAKDGSGFKIFERDRGRHLGAAIKEKRLASPDHYRLYFALIGPSHALTQANYTLVWTAAEVGADRVGAALLKLHDERVGISLSKADLLLENIKSGACEALTPQQCENLLVAFSKIMDDAYRRYPFDQFWVNSLWDRAERVTPKLVSRIESSRRTAVLAEMFGEGPAIGWLTSIFRYETFAHGRHGDRRRPEGEWLLSDTELDAIAEVILGRYRKMSASEVFASPNPISLLFAWQQGGDERGPRELIEANVVSNAGLVETLEHLTSTVETSSRGRLEVLKRRNLDPFMNWEEASQRLQSLKDDNDLGQRARRLISASDDASRY